MNPLSYLYMLLGHPVLSLFTFFIFYYFSLFYFIVVERERHALLCNLYVYDEGHHYGKIQFIIIQIIIITN